MAERLSFILVQPRHVLRWSGWLGGGGEVLQQAYPKAETRIAEPMPELLARSRAAQGRTWWQAWRGKPGSGVLDVESIEPGRADLLWANMALHASDDPPAWLSHWHSMLAVDGFVMFSCLGPGTLKELRGIYRAQGWSVPTLPFVDMHDLGDMMVAAGFADPVMDQETIRLQWHDAASALRELRSLGGNASPQRWPGLRTPRWRAQLEAALTDSSADGRPALSFELVFGHAFKVPPKLTVKPETSIPLERMREMTRRGRPGGE